MKNSTDDLKGKVVEARFSFVINAEEIGDPNNFGYVTSFTVNAGNGKLTKKGQVKAGRWVRQLVVHPSQKFLFVANYISNDILSYSVKPSDGTLKLVQQPARRGGDSIAMTPDGKFLYAAGSANTLHVYAVDETTGMLTGKPSPMLPAGFKPYEVTLMPSGKFLYVLDAASDNIFGFTIDPASGALTALPVGPFPRGTGRGTLVADPLDRFLFVANNYDDAPTEHSLWAYRIDGATGGLTKVGSLPDILTSNSTGIGITPLGTFLYTTSSALVDIIGVNQTTGEIKRVDVFKPGNDLFPNAACVDPSGRFLYTTNGGSSGSVALYKIASDGNLRAVTSPVRVEPSPTGIVIVKKI
jgi:6-phosphogluconolactonase (cycloisomerase 2 family)